MRLTDALRGRNGLILATAMLGAAVAGAQVQLDSGFGVGGVATLDPGSGTTTAGGFAAAPDGSMFVAGSFTPPGQGRLGFVARMTATGAPDSGFADAGLYTADFGAFSAFTGLARQGDGKLLALGNNGPYSTVVMRVVRLTPAGAPDASFDGDGVAEVDATYAFNPVAAVVQPDGRIVVAANSAFRVPAPESGLTVFRLLAGGALDGTFGPPGTAGFAVAEISGFDAAAALALQPDGRIVVVGSTNAATPGNTGVRDVAVARFTADGRLDPSFGSGGTLALPIGALDDDALAVLVQPDGRIVIGGSTYQNGSRSDCALVRLNADGSPDGGFGTGGIATYNLGALSACNAVARQADGALLAAGSWADNIDALFMVMRVHSDGAPDTSFSGGISWTWVNPSPAADAVLALATQPGGGILAAGGTGAGAVAVARFLAAVPDTSPDPFAFTELTNVPRGALAVSDPITITGIAVEAPVVVSGGEYSVDGGAFTAAAGSVAVGATIRVRHVASLHPSTSTSTTLTVGDFSAIFTSITEPPRLRRRRVAPTT